MNLKISLLTTACFISLAILGQPVLNFETHALKQGYDNDMSYCNYTDPGPAGEDRIWDFSDLEFEKAFTGFILPSDHSETGMSFSTSNTELQEFNSRFYFSVRDDRMEQYGYSTTDGSVQTRYTEPFIKMKFPFLYQDIYSGNFSGSVFYNGIERGSITGGYTVAADAWGKLVLPGNIPYENTLRVKTEKYYVNELADSEQEVFITTYRWYNSIHRYPLLVLTEYSVSANGQTIINYQAAYNNRAVKGISPAESESLLLYPNPATDHMVIEYNAIAAGTLTFTIIDKAGAVIYEFDHQVLQAGLQQINLSDRISSLIPSNYLLVIKNGNQTQSQSFSVVE